jgi:hypothetical protein
MLNDEGAGGERRVLSPECCVLRTAEGAGLTTAHDQMRSDPGTGTGNSVHSRGRLCYTKGKGVGGWAVT